MNKGDSLSDWLVWLFYGFIVTLATHPLRRLVFSDVYKEMGNAQEIFIFSILTIGTTYIIIRPMAHFFKGTNSTKVMCQKHDHTPSGVVYFTQATTIGKPTVDEWGQRYT